MEKDMLHHLFRHLIGRYSSFTFSSTLFTFMLLVFQVSAGDYQNPSDGILSMRYADGALSLETMNAPLDKVLKELSRLQN